MLKRKSKRVLSIVLAVAMIVGLFPIAAFADEGTTPAEQTPISTVSALPDADGNGVITLDKNITLENTVDIERNTVIDLNGHTLSYNGDGGVFLHVKSGELIIRDSGDKGIVQVNEETDNEETDSGLRCIQVDANATFTLEGGTIENTNTAFEATQVISNYGTVNIESGSVKGVTCIFMFNPVRGSTSWTNAEAVCNVNGGNIEGVPATTYNDSPNYNESSVKDLNWCYGITIYGPGVTDGTGTVDNSKSTLNINGGTITAGQGIGTNASSGRYAGFTINMTGGTVDGTENGTGMYLPAIGVTNISGGTVTGAQGIRICAGDLNITGGTIEGTALSDGADLIAGGSGGTTGAIVVGKASDGYVGNINVKVSENAQVVNTAKKGQETAVAPAIVVSDKNMALTTDQQIKDADGNIIAGETFKYSESAINVTINAPVSGDVVKISNLTQNTTQDGGNTNLNLDGSTVTGNVINRSGSNMSVDNTTVTGNVSNSSSGSILVNNSNVMGAVNNISNGNLAVLDSNVGGTDKNVTMVNSTVNGASVEDTATDKVEAYIGATPYETLEAAIKAAEDGETVQLLKDITIDATDSTRVSQGVINILSNITLDGNGKTIKAGNNFDYNTDANRGEHHVIAVMDPATNVVIKDLTIDGSNAPTSDPKNGARSGINVWSDDQKINVTVENVSVKNCSTYGLTVTKGDVTIDGLTTENNVWGGINADNKQGDANLIVNNANLSENSSIVFDKGGTGKITATINGGSFRDVVMGKDANEKPITTIDSLRINGGTFKTAGIAHAIDVEDYLAPGLVYNPYTGQVYKEPEYTGKYSYEIFTKVGDNGTISVDRYATEGDNVTITVSPDEAYMLDELTVTANGKEVEVKDNGDGTYTFKMPSADAKIVVTFAEDPDWEPEPEEPAMPFTDVNEGDWFYDVVLYAYDNGLMTGVSATEFAPNQTTTRGMIVSMLARLEGVTSAEDAGFADVAENDWYATAVNWAASVGVVNGYEDNTFRPNAAITREQMAAILYNYADYKGYDVSARADLSDYADAASISSWAEDVLAWANAEGLINGMTATTIDPQGATTRAQTAAMFERFLTAHEA